MYVSVSGSLKGFQDKKRAVAFSVRQVIEMFLTFIRVHYLLLALMFVTALIVNSKYDYLKF